MKIRWAPAAEMDRAQIFHHIEAQDPDAAIRMDELFTKAVSRLQHFPFMGRRGVITGTRDIIPHESYRVVYQDQGAGRLDPDDHPYCAQMAAK